MKIVLDTNVFISGIFWTGTPNKILEALLGNKVMLAVSPCIIDEYYWIANGLSKKFPNINASEIIKDVILYSEICSNRQLKTSICRDKDDDKFIACAIEAKAKIIVSGDKDLLVCKELPNKIEVIDPATFKKKFLN